MISKEKALRNALDRVIAERYDLKAACEGYRTQLMKLEAENNQIKFEHKVFKKALFDIGVQNSCMHAAHRKGFVSPAQAGDDAREYLSDLLKNAAKLEKKDDAES